MDSCQALKQRGNLKVCPSNTFLVRQSVVEEKFIVSKVDDRKRMYNFGHPHLCHEGSETIEDHSTTTFPKLAVLRMELFEALVTIPGAVV